MIYIGDIHRAASLETVCTGTASSFTGLVLGTKTFLRD
jgi:hypothetical protein